MELMNIDIRKIGKKGREIFKRISGELERDHRGKFVAIEVDSGDYFIGDTSVEASRKVGRNTPVRCSTRAKSAIEQPFHSRGDESDELTRPVSEQSASC